MHTSEVVKHWPGYLFGQIGTYRTNQHQHTSLQGEGEKVKEGTNLISWSLGKASAKRWSSGSTSSPLAPLPVQYTSAAAKALGLWLFVFFFVVSGNKVSIIEPFELTWWFIDDRFARLRRFGIGWELVMTYQTKLSKFWGSACSDHSETCPTHSNPQGWYLQYRFLRDRAREEGTDIDMDDAKDTNHR